MSLSSQQSACSRAVAIVLWIVLLVVLGASQALADTAPFDWSAVVKQYSGMDDLSIRERFELAIAHANTGGFLAAQREFEALDRVGWHEEAGEMMAESMERLEEEPDSLIDLNIVAFASYVMQDHELSCTTFERILEVDDGNDWPRLYLAWTYGSLGRIDEGIAELEYMVKKHPLNLYIRLLLVFAKTQR